MNTSAGRLLRVLVALLALACLASLVVVARADAFIYWTNSNSGSIGRANQDGSGANQFFISGCTHPLAITVDDRYVYWSNESKQAIGRANLDGTGVNQEFVKGVTDWVYGMTVTGDYIFWTTPEAIVGRANIDGTGVNNSFLSYPVDESGWDIYAHGPYVFWSFNDGQYKGLHRARLDGSDKTSILKGTNMAWDAQGLWVGASYIYWQNGMYIGRALTPDGWFWNTAIADMEWSGHGLSKDDDYLYWASNGGQYWYDMIVRVRPNGRDEDIVVDHAVDGPWDCEVDELTVPSSLRALRAQMIAEDLPGGITSAVSVKLRAAAVAFGHHRPRVARARMREAAALLKAQSGLQVPADLAARWVRALQLLRFQAVRARAF
jgi:hypothetical protein